MQCIIFNMFQLHCLRTHEDTYSEDLYGDVESLHVIYSFFLIVFEQQWWTLMNSILLQKILSEFRNQLKTRLIFSQPLNELHFPLLFRPINITSSRFLTNTYLSLQRSFQNLTVFFYSWHLHLSNLLPTLTSTLQNTFL